MLATAPVLRAPNFSRPLTSDMGVGTVLVQADSNGVEHPVTFFSKQLSPCQVCYSTTEKESLAVVP